MNTPFPEVLRRDYFNWRFFKAKKRAEIRKLIRADEEVVHASAYLPPEAYRLTCRMRNDMRRVQQLLSVKEWGR